MGENKINIEDLNTYAQNTWCPGCGNFGIELATKQAIVELVSEGLRLEDIVMVSGIGCHAKIVDYVNVNSFYSLHGRVIPPATGIKIANPDLKVIGFAGDGDAYGEGLEHLIFAAKRNIDITLLVHDNRVYALTTGQFTPTSPQGFPGRSTPRGSVEKPFNPLELMLASHASFVARGYAARTNQLKEIIKQAVKHKGFSFIDVLQPCFTYFNTYATYNERVYDLGEEYDPTNFDSALEKAREWDYSSKEGRIPLGVFYKKEEATFDEEILKGRKLRGEKVVDNFENVLKEKI